MRLFNSPSTSQTNFGLAILRSVAGIVFAAHGAQKLFVYGFAGVSGAFAGMGVPMPGIVGPGVALLEFAGGIALIAGILTRPVAALLLADMLGAVLMVHLKNGFFMPTGYEFALTLASVAATLVVTGAGAFSVDAVIANRTPVNRTSANRMHANRPQGSAHAQTAALVSK